MHIKLEEIKIQKIFQYNGIYNISILIDSLINPRFLIKEGEYNLYILMHNYTSGYIVTEIASEIIEAIKGRKCYIVFNNNDEHMIELNPI